jgi:lipopolysaccharide export system protein LptC
VAMTGTAPGNFSRRTAPGSRRAVVQAAYRHSRAVRVMRIVLPAVAALMLAATAVLIIFDPRVMLAAQMDVASTSFSGSRIIMARPRLTGYGLDSSGKPKAYEVTAERAEQNMAKPNEVDLFEIKANMGLREDGWAELRATSGHMNNASQVLDLFEQIQITTDLGDRADLTQAHVDFTAGEITSEKPVDIKFVRADLVADTMHLYENGQRAVFTGRVAMVLKPDPAAPVASTYPQAPQ